MKRLIDDPEVVSELRAELQRYAAEQAQVDLKRAYAGLEDSLQLKASNSVGASHGSFSGGPWSALSSSAKLLIIAAIGGTLVVAVTALRSTEHTLQGPTSPQPPAAPSPSLGQPAENSASSAAPQTTPGSASTGQQARSALPSASLQTNSAQASVALQTNSPKPSAKLPTTYPQPSTALQTSSPTALDGAELSARRNVAASSSSRREIAQLARIKTLLETNPAAARRLIRAAQREFPAGLLVEEREGLDVIALFALGQHERARANAGRFVARYPHSPLRPKLERLIADAHE
jgi:hypothetical protein